MSDPTDPIVDDTTTSAADATDPDLPPEYGGPSLDTVPPPSPPPVNLSGPVTREQAERAFPGWGGAAWDASRSATAAVAQMNVDEKAMEARIAAMPLSTKQQIARDIDDVRKLADELKAKLETIGPALVAIPLAGPYLAMAAKGVALTAIAIAALDDALAPFGW